MRRARCFRFVLGVIAIVAICYVFSNHYVDCAIVFSHDSGFYNSPIWLSMQSNGGKIYYTLDSSEPDESSNLYTEPILIRNINEEPDIYSSISDVSPYFADGFAEKEGYHLTRRYTKSETVDKAVIVKAVSISDDGRKNDVSDRAFFVDYNSNSSYKDIGIVSIVTKPEDLFDIDNGIYVMGSKFVDQYFKSEYNSDYAFDYIPANYRQRGKESERKASISIFNMSHRLVFQTQEAGLRIQGGGSRAWLPKNLNIYNRSISNRDGFLIEYEKGNSISLNSLTLFAGGQDDKTMLKDYLINETCKKLDIMTRVFVPLQVFLQGEYWGFYWGIPQIKEEYISKKYGLDEKEIIVVKNGGVETGTTEDYRKYKEDVVRFTELDMSLEENYSLFQKTYDIDSLIDYYAVEAYICNYDWDPTRNYAMWRTKNNSNRDYEDGKWRFVIFDVNLSQSNNDTCSDYIYRFETIDSLFSSLMDNKDFREKIYKKMLFLAYNVFYPPEIDKIIEDYIVNIGPYIMKKYERFYWNQFTEEDFINGCAAVKMFFQERYEYMIDTYGDMDNV